MLFSYNWLKQFVDIKKTPQELAEDLSLKSVEIGDIYQFGGDFLENVVVGEIKEIKDHPNADKLKITIVDIGAKDASPLQIICGAPNIAVGQKVPVALVGTKLPAGKIEKAKIRGVESFGMLAAEDELNLGSDHTGIMILDDNLKVGTKLSEIYNDWVLDGDVLPNRGDLQNHWGLAREINAIYNKAIKQENKKTRKQESLPRRQAGNKIVFIKDRGNEINEILDVVNDNLDICPVYMARVIKNIKIAPSPVWIQQRLLACGMRPINNVVDITNYVMLEYGNPLHAFDATKIRKDEYGRHKIVVRLSEKEEKIRTLDGEIRDLPEGLLVIADEKEPIAVAGIMGGENSEISEETSTVILESATFNPSLIRKGQRELGIRTEASSRFEKGLSFYLAEICLDRAAKLMEEICGGEIVSGKIVAGNAGAIHELPKEIGVNLEELKQYLSLNIKDREISIILDNLGIKNEFKDNILICTSPPWRKDINIWQDIAEEVGRIYGYERIKEKLPETEIKPQIKKILYFEQSAKKYLVSIGLTEVFSYSILSQKIIEKTNIKDYYFEIMNPLNEEDFIMRSGLWNGLLEYAKENAKKFDKFAFFDLSKVYLPHEIPQSGNFAKSEIISQGKPSKEKNVPAYEPRKLAILVYGEKDNEGIFILKKYLDDFAKNFGLEFTYKNNAGDVSFCHPGRSAQIFYKGSKIGRISEIHPLVLENLDLKKRVWVAEINFDALVEDAKNIEEKFKEIASDVVFKPYSLYEVSKRDIAIVVDEKTNLGEIIDIIKGTDDKIIAVDLFDEYKSDKIGKGKKSLAYHLIFQAPDRTLKDEEVDELFGKIVGRLEKKLGAKLRG